MIDARLASVRKSNQYWTGDRRRPGDRRARAGGAKPEAFALRPQKETAFDHHRIAGHQAGRHVEALPRRLAQTNFSFLNCAGASGLRMYTNDRIP